MSIEESLGVAGLLVLVVGPVIGVVRWLYKSRLENSLKDLDKRIGRLEDEYIINTANDQALKERVIKIESSHDSLNTTMLELKDMVKTVLNKLEERQEVLSDLKREVAVLKQKITDGN